MILSSAQLRKLRKDAGLTQKQLSKLVGVSQAHIAKIEKGKVDPRLSIVNKILEVLTEREGKKCKDIMTLNVVFAKPTDKVLNISKVMIRKAISQLPVTKDSKIIGTITEESIIRNLKADIADEKVENIMEPPLPSVTVDTDVNTIKPLLEVSSGILVTQNGEVIGIITRSDLLKTVSGDN